MRRVCRDGEDDPGMFAEVTDGTVDGKPAKLVTLRFKGKEGWVSGLFTGDTSQGRQAAAAHESGVPFVPGRKQRKWRGRDRG